MRHHKQKGFTLIELVMVIMIMGIISVVIGRFLFSAYTLVTTSSNVSETDWQGFIALERLTDDIHSIRSAADITTISSSQLVFTDDAGTTVTYQLSGGALLRNSITLASGVQSLTFGYKDSTYTTTAVAANVRYITISITMIKNNLSVTFPTMIGTRGMQ